MPYNYDCFAYLRPIYYIYQLIFLNDDTYKEIYKNDIVPEIWRASWIHWRKKIEKKNNKPYLIAFIDAFFDFLRINQVYHDNMCDEEIETIVKNRKTYFPSNSYIRVQTLIPSLVYKISVITEMIHHKYGKLKILNTYKKYVMSNTYYTNEELLLRKINKNTDIIIGNWIISDSFYYDYKNPTQTYYVIANENS